MNVPHNEILQSIDDHDWNCLHEYASVSVRISQKSHLACNTKTAESRAIKWEKKYVLCLCLAIRVIIKSVFSHNLIFRMYV